MNIKEYLILILDALNEVETKGNSTVILANCIESMQQVIANMSSDDEEESTEDIEDNEE